MQNKKIKKSIVFSVKLASVFLLVVLGVGIFTKSAKASENCFCSNKSTWNPLQLFQYPITGRFDVKNDFACNQRCVALTGSTYYSYSNLANLAFSPVKPCASDVDCKDATVPICNKSTGICLSEADAAKTPTSEMIGGAIVNSTPTSSAPISANDIIPGTSEPGGLVQCGRAGQKMCTLCDIIIGINNLIKFGFRISLVIALTMITVGGVLYMVGNIDQAKGIFWATLKGIIFVFMAWLLVNYSIVILGARSNLGITQVGSWFDFKCK